MNSPYPYPPHTPQKSAEDTNAAWGRRTDDHLGSFKVMLETHTTEEMERYAEIIGRLDQTETNLASLNRGQQSMNQSITAFMEGQGTFIAAIIRAFPRDDEGKPDYDGHKKAHLSWISNARDEREVMEFVRKQMTDEKKSSELLEYTKKVIFAGAALAIVSFIAIATWAAFLKGPVG
jgi:hypothetical protein